MSLSERLQWIVTADSTSAVNAFKKAGDAADRELGKAEKKLDNVGSAFTKFGAGAAVAGGVLGGALIKAASKFEDLAISALKFSTATGTTTEQASRLIESTKSIGLSSDDLATSLNFMNKTLGKTPAVFAQYGVAVARAKDGTEDVEGTFLNVVDRLKAIPDAGARAAAGTALLGKGWKSLSTLIEQGSDQIKTSMAAVSDGQVISPAEAASAQAYQAAIDNLHDSFENLTLAIGKGAAPVLGNVAKVISSGVDAFTKLDSITGGAAGEIATLGAVGLAAAGGLSLVVGAVIKVKSNLSDGAAAVGNFADKLKGSRAAAESAASATDLVATADSAAAVAADELAASTAASVAAAEAAAVAVAQEEAAFAATATSLDLAAIAEADNAAATAAATAAREAAAVEAAIEAAALGEVATAAELAAVASGADAAAELAATTARKAAAAAALEEAAALEANAAAAEADSVALTENAAAQKETGIVGAGLGAGLVVTGLAMFAFSKQASQAADRAKDLTKAIAETSTAAQDELGPILTKIIADSLLKGGKGFDDLAKSNLAGAVRLRDYAKTAGVSADVVDLLTAAINKQVAANAQGAKTSADYGDALDTANQNAAEGAGLLNGLTAATTAQYTAVQTTGDVYSIAARAQAAYTAALAPTAAESARLARVIDLQAQAAIDAATAATDAAVRWNGYEASLAGIASASDKVARESGYLASSLGQVADAATGSERANLNLDDSYSKLTQARKDNGKSLSENTQKGRDNQRAILDTADAIRDNLVQQLEDSGGSYEQVTRAADDYRAQLKDQLAQFGLTGDAADAYIAKLGLAPDQITTSIVLAGQAKAKDDLDALNISIDDIPAEKKSEFVADVTTGDYASALALFTDLAKPGGHPREAPFDSTVDTTAVDGALRELEAEHDLPVVVTTPQGTTVTVDADTAEARADIHRLDGTVVNVNLRAKAGLEYASGTDKAKPGLAEVAEQGPEIIEGKDGARLVKDPSLVVLRGGERIYTASETAAILRGGAGTGPGTAIPGYATGAGRVQNITHVTTPAAPAPGTADPTASADDVVKEQDRIQAAMYETGRISLDAYKQYVQGRLAASQDLSDDYLTQYRLLKQLNDDSVKGTNDQIAAQDDLEKNMHDLNVITDAEYQDYLKSRLGSFAAYTDGYTEIYKQIQQIDADEAAAQKQKIADAADVVKALYQQAQAAKDAGQAAADQAKAFNDVQSAGAEGSRIQNDRKSTADDKATAVQKLIDSEVALGDKTYSAVLASASAAGLDVGSVDWDRFVRAALSDYIGQYGALPYTTGVLRADLAGIPALKDGGIVKARPGGTIARLGEAGKDEAVVPLDGQFGNTVIHNHINVDIHTLTGRLSPRDVDYLRTELAKGNRRNGLAAVS